MSLAELAALSGCAVSTGGSDRVVSKAATLKDACAGDIAFLSNRKYGKDAETTSADACVISPELAPSLPEACIALTSADPYTAFTAVLRALYPGYRPINAGLEPCSVAVRNAFISPDATVADSACIGPGAVIEKGAVIGEHTRIGAHSVIGAHVHIGAHSIIAPHCVIECTIIGTHTEILTGARIGQEGFGFASSATGDHITVPQIGRVIIGNNVHIGANSCIDRGSLQDTVIEDKVRIDNLVQIGHNVRISRGAVIVAQVGIAGSARVGSYAVIAGQAGVAGHLTIGDRAIISAQTGVAQDLPGNATYGGTPAVPILQYHRQHLHLKKQVKARSKKD